MPYGIQTTDKPYCKQDSSLNRTNFLLHFSFDTAGAKEKFTKENAIKGVSHSAEREEGFSPSTPQTFEKV